LQYTLLKLTSDNIQYLNAIGWSTGGAPGVKKSPTSTCLKKFNFTACCLDWGDWKNWPVDTYIQNPTC